MALREHGQRTAPVASRPPPVRPVVAWAVVGAALLAFELAVLLRWVIGPNFRPTEPGPDPISDGARALYVVLQVLVPLAAVVALYHWVVRPWRREGRLTTDGMLVLAGAMLFFWDMSLNHTATALFYNSHFLNFGSWANGAWPGWMSPYGDRLPEPVLICQPGYTSLVFSQVMFMLAVLRRIAARRPGLGPWSAVGILTVGLTVTATIMESILLRIGIYAYPHGIRWLTLYAGETYQLPMTEPIFFGGLGLGSIAALSWFRNDRGETLVERGASALILSGRRLQWVRLLAIFGGVHAAFAVLYFLPCQWLATHGDPFPAGYPSYLVNGMCDYLGNDPTRPPCPAPGVPIPRP